MLTTVAYQLGPHQPVTYALEVRHMLTYMHTCHSFFPFSPFHPLPSPPLPLPSYPCSLLFSSLLSLSPPLPLSSYPRPLLFSSLLSPSPPLLLLFSSLLPPSPPLLLPPIPVPSSSPPSYPPPLLFSSLLSLSPPLPLPSFPPSHFLNVFQGAVSIAGQSVRWLRDNLEFFRDASDIGKPTTVLYEYI